MGLGALGHERARFVLAGSRHEVVGDVDERLEREQGAAFVAAGHEVGQSLGSVDVLLEGVCRGRLGVRHRL